MRFYFQYVVLLSSILNYIKDDILNEIQECNKFKSKGDIFLKL